MHRARYLLFCSICLLLGSTAASANTEKQGLLTEIVEEMDRFGEVATVTKQNEQYQPYIISVFQGHELEKLGIHNLKEALLLVPGVDISTDNTNYQTPIFRGSNPFAFGQSKLLVDGVLVNDLFLDGYSSYLSMPIDIIKRIEVVRGPGSKTDGINAYAGSINVITYAEELEGFENDNKLFFKGGSYNYRMGGFVANYKSGEWTLFSDFYYQQDDKKLPVGSDAAATGIYNFPHLGIDNTVHSRSGEAPVWLKNYSLGLMLQYRDFVIRARTLYLKQGSAYGLNAHLPNDEDYVKLPSDYVELAYSHAFGSYHADIKAGIKFDSFYSQSQLSPPGYELPSLSDPYTTKTVYPDGFYGKHESKQRTIYQSSFLKYRGFDAHNIAIGYRLLKEETYALRTITTDRDSGVGLTDYTETYPFFNQDAERNIFIISLQDQFDFSENLSFMYGLNMENNSINSAEVDPRFSMVYQPDAKNIFKTIYSKSHRDPSWQEMYTVNNYARVGNPELETETVHAFEAAYIRKFSSDSYLQADLFHLSNNNQIDKINEENEFRNAVDTTIYGFELEYKGSFTRSDQFYVNYTYVNGEDDENHALPNVAKHLLKGFYTYNISPLLSASSVARYVGSKERVYYDDRGKLDDYLCVDATLRYEDHQNRYAIVLAVKNVFDERIKYPSEPMTYVEDYPQEERYGLISFSKAF